MNIRTLISLLASVALVGIICISAVAQNRASVRGQVSDEFGASIVGATVTVTDANGAAKTATTGPDGTYTINGLAPGKYKVHALLLQRTLKLMSQQIVANPSISR